MGKHTEDFYKFIGEGFNRTEAAEKADKIALNRVLDEDEEYLREQEALEDEELEELDGYNEDDPEDLDFDEIDPQDDEIDFEDGYIFTDLEEDEY